jgi:hypothetical protein
VPGNAPNIVPPPWTLTGRGFVLVYRFPREWALRHAGMPLALASGFVGGIGAVMIVDYATSDCGPYRELLFVPGRFRAGNGALFYAITRIFVSTQISVDSGIANWAIPKELAGFEWNLEGERESVRVTQRDVPAAEFHFSSSGNFTIPVTTDILPARFRTLAQLEESGETVLTAPSGSGVVRLAKLEEVTVNSALFPDLSEFKPILVARADPFRLGFPVPKRENLRWS